jgi:hypothetical protein
VTWERIALVSVLSLLAFEGVVLAAAPNELQNLLGEVAPGVLRVAGLVELVAAVALLALFLFGG